MARLEDVLDVRADGVGADIEDAPDRLVAPALAEEGKHLAFPQRQAVDRGLAHPVLGVEELAEHPRQGRTWFQLAVSQGALHGVRHGGGTAGLEDHPKRAGADGVHDELQVHLEG